MAKTLEIPKVAEPTAASYGVEFDMDEEGIASNIHYPEGPLTFEFWGPGRRLPPKRLYTVKALSPKGVIVQLPMEEQINNHKASPQDLLGLRLYERKGFIIFMKDGKGLFCPTWGCHAAWNSKFKGFCSEAHIGLTLPEGTPGAFSENVTTSTVFTIR